MIGKLKGKIESNSEDGQVIVDVNGVGYLAFCSGKTLSKLTPGEYAELLIETHVREDHIHLYGFYNAEEKNTFIILQSVKGVGTRMALAILSELTPEEIGLALTAQDKVVFNNVSGVGKKLAERIITELKDKFITNTSGVAPIKTGAASANSTNDNMHDAVAALVSLGIGKSDAQIRINSILSESPDISINDLIKLGLKNSN
ncbi:MAG: Holliday junction branch migration protein RuvA [Pseudomonadota bacterium]